uniref:Uncharacterized protein n=1 Tax=Oryza barthii TaxID=65489 RepID=A0A0D3H5T6_9ORYZ
MPNAWHNGWFTCF